MKAFMQENSVVFARLFLQLRVKDDEARRNRGRGMRWIPRGVAQVGAVLNTNRSPFENPLYAAQPLQ
jgi:hypothetical protein